MTGNGDAQFVLCGSKAPSRPPPKGEESFFLRESTLFFFCLFITAAIGLSFCGAVGIGLLSGIGVVAIFLGALLARGWGRLLANYLWVLR